MDDSIERNIEWIFIQKIVFEAEQLWAQHIFKMSRFGSATKEDIQDLHDQKHSLNTKQLVNHSVKVVREYCREKGSNVEFEKLSIGVILCWSQEERWRTVQV